MHAKASQAESGSFQTEPSCGCAETHDQGKIPRLGVSGPLTDPDRALSLVPPEFQDPEVLEALGKPSLYHASPRNSLATLKWPGLGVKCADSDVIFRTLVCPTGDYRKVITYNCWDRTCPAHWPGPIARTAEDVACKVWGLRSLMGTRYLPREVFLVPPRGFIDPNNYVTGSLDSDRGLDLLYRWGKETLRTMGASAFTLSIHLFHIKKEFEKELNDEASRRGYGEDGRKLNRYDILRERINRGEPREKYEEFYPHLHAITYGHINAAARPPGSLVKTNRKLIASEDELFGKLFYILSHAAIVPGRRSIRDYGLLRQMKKVKEYHDLAEERCPICGAVLVDELTGAPEYKKVLRRVYEWRPPPAPRSPAQGGGGTVAQAGAWFP